MPGSRVVELDLTGLSCGACARRVEKTLNKIGGARASVDFGARVATIEAADDISVSDLCDAVRKAGYGAEQRIGTSTEGEHPVPRQHTGVGGALIEHVAPIARWLLAPLHR